MDKDKMPLRDIRRINDLLESTTKKIDGGYAVINDSSYYNKSKPGIIVGNGTLEILPAECKRVLRAILVSGDGNAGTAKVMIGETCVLPVYFSVGARTATSSALRLEVKADEAVTMITAGRGGTNETFVGVTYMDCVD